MSGTSRKNLSQEEKVLITPSYRNIEEPSNIEGPVNFIYLTGDPGDGITRKVLLLGDIHSVETKCDGRRGTMDVVNFFRYLAEKVKPQILDVFLEVNFDTGEEELNSSIPSFMEEGNYINNVVFELKDCLHRDKTHCVEPMRIHYVDVRKINRNLSSFTGISTFLFNVINQTSHENMMKWSKFEWPAQENIDTTVRRSLNEARLTNDKLASLDTKIRNKFINRVYKPTFNKIVNFYRDAKNRDELEHIKKIAAYIIKTNFRLNREQYFYINRFYDKFIRIQSYIMDTYFVYRLLKKATRLPSHLGVALPLKSGESSTRIVSYTGISHSFQIRDMLLAMNFKLEDSADISDIEEKSKHPEIFYKINQCLDFSLIKSSVDDFCSYLHREPDYILGAVNFIYLVNDQDDSTTRKILLLGDIHAPMTKCETGTTMPDFCRYVASRLLPSMLDVFIESRFDTDGKSAFLPSEEKEGYYLNNLRYEFRDCLTKNKSKCDEAFRIHYIDPRKATSSDVNPLALSLLSRLLSFIQYSTYEGGIWEEAFWPEEKDISYTVNLALSEARLTEKKFKNLGVSVRIRFKHNIIKPIVSSLNSFYRNKNNKDLFYRIKDISSRIIEKGIPLSETELELIQGFYIKIVKLQSPLLDAYFIYRLLKKTTSRKSERPEVALPIGDFTTRVLSYTGAGHTFQIRDKLVKMGFRIIAAEDRYEMESLNNEAYTYEGDIIQCLPYSVLRGSVDDFIRRS